jgi:hypothetical protein
MAICGEFAVDEALDRSKTDNRMHEFLISHLNCV